MITPTSTAMHGSASGAYRDSRECRIRSSNMADQSANQVSHVWIITPSGTIAQVEGMAKGIASGTTVWYPLRMASEEALRAAAVINNVLSVMGGGFDGFTMPRVAEIIDLEFAALRDERDKLRKALGTRGWAAGRSLGCESRELDENRR